MPDLEGILGPNRLRFSGLRLNSLSLQELIAFKEGPKSSSLEAGRGYGECLSCVVRANDIFPWRKRPRRSRDFRHFRRKKRR
jgi:hypothetical protein